MSMPSSELIHGKPSAEDRAKARRTVAVNARSRAELVEFLAMLDLDKR